MQQFGPSAGSAFGSRSEKAGAIRPFFLWRALGGEPSRQERAGVSRPPGQWHFLPWLVLLIGIPASAFLFDALSDAVEDVARLRFERQASDAKSVIEGRIHSYSNVLYGLKGLFATQNSVSRVEFHRFVKSLDLKSRYPGFDVVNFAAYVPAHDAERFVQTVRKDTSLHPTGYPDFAIKPPGERPEYFVVAYLEPMAGYEFAFGRDLSANPQVADPGALVSALHLARDSGKLTASGMPIRIKTGREYVGLALRLPVYRLEMPLDTVEQRRAAYVGSVGAGFNIQELMKGVLNEETLRKMRFALYDAGAADGPGGTAGDRRLLFDSNQLIEPASRVSRTDNPDAAFSRVLSIEVGGRTWEIHFSEPRRFAVEPFDMLLPWALLLGGIVSSVLLCGVLYSLASSRSRAEKIAIDMTKHLRESETSLAEAHALLNDAQKLAGLGCCEYSPEDGRVIWSEELYRIHGVDAQAFSPSYDTAMQLLHPDDRAAWSQTLQNALRDGDAFAAEFRIIRPDGTVRHLRSLGEVLKDSSGRPLRMLWSVLDITEHKETEHALRSSAEQLTALSRRLVEVQEAERRQLSRELHDRVGQNLTALSINLDILNTTLAGEPYADHRARLSDSSVLLESTVDSIENVMAELRPPMLDDYGLLPALHWYAKDFSRRTGIDVAVTGNESAERLAPQLEITLFRIAQEGLTNVTKHARAKRVEIALEHCESQCVMTISDDGVGIDSPSHNGSHRHGLGMVTMRERSQAVGGRFSVTGMPGGGTRIAITVP